MNRGITRWLQALLPIAVVLAAVIGARSMVALKPEAPTRPPEVTIPISGLVTIEDVLEEIVGEIVDEYDADLVQQIERIDDRTTETLARVHLDEINEQLGLALPDDGDFDTIGGFVFSQLGHIPVPGEVLLWVLNLNRRAERW